MMKRLAVVSVFASVGAVSTARAESIDIGAQSVEVSSGQVASAKKAASACWSDPSNTDCRMYHYAKKACGRSIPIEYDEDVWKYAVATGSHDGLDRSEEIYGVVGGFCDDSKTKGKNASDDVKKIHVTWVKPKGPWEPPVKLTNGTLDVTIGLGSPSLGTSAPNSTLTAFFRKK